MVTKVNVEGALLFEQPFAKVPYESYRKVFRTSQRYLERDLGGVQAASKGLSEQAKSSDYRPEEALKSIDNIIGKVESLKRKLSELHENVGAPTQEVMRNRLEHINKLDGFIHNEHADCVRWTDTRLDRWLVDWALRTGREKTAIKIAQEKGIEKLVDIDLFTEIRRIEEALRQHSCTEALAWCSENKVALRKIKSTLEFDLRMQEYIELARERRTEEAIAYSIKHLAQWQETHLSKIRQVSALLAFSPETHCGPYKRLYDRGRWTTLADSFRKAVYQLNSLPSEPLLHLALYAGLAALKLPVCYESNPHELSKEQSSLAMAFDSQSSSSSSSSSSLSSHSHSSQSEQSRGPTTNFTSMSPPSGRNVDCPICDNNSLGELAREVPWSHHLNSTIVCWGTGKIMDADNPPLAFPVSGFVYSKEFLEGMAAKNGDRVRCPRSGEECALSDLRKVYIS